MNKFFEKNKIEKIVLIFPVVCIVSLIVGIFLPVYSDEVMNKIYSSRFFVDDGIVVSFFPQCAASFGNKISVVFFPAAIILSLIFEDLNPLGIRISGVVVALIWFILFSFLCRIQESSNWIKRYSWLISLSSLGVMPYLWVMSRPEQLMTISALIFCILVFLIPKISNKTVLFFGFCFFIITISVFFFVHPKSFFFAPFFLIGIWFATINNNFFIRCAGVCFVLIVTLQTIKAAIASGACPDAAYVQQIFSENIIKPEILFHDPLNFINMIIRNVIYFPNKVFHHLSFNNKFQSGWLPPIDGAHYLRALLNPIIEFLINYFVIAAHMLAIFSGGVFLFIKKKNISVILAVLIAGSNLLIAALFNAQNFYAATQYVPFSLIIFALLLPVFNQYFNFISNAVDWVMVFVVGILLFISFAINVTMIFPSLMVSSNSESAKIEQQPISVPVFKNEMHLLAIKKLGRSCNLPEANGNFLIIDQMTYFAYSKNKNPAHIHYVSEEYYGVDLKGRFLEFFKEKNSPGLITRCEWVPENLKSKMISENMGYCCVNFNN